MMHLAFSRPMRSLISILALLLLAPTAKADVPHQVSYQGFLQDSSGDPVPDGPYDITFAIYGQATGGSELWSSGVVTISVSNGLFEHALGSSNPLPDSLFSGGSDRYLGIQVGADPELAPRTRLLSSPYALQARGAELAHVFRLIPGDTPGGCDPDGRGEMYFDSVLNEPCYCSGSHWRQVDGGGPCECPDLDNDGYDGCDPGHPKDTDNLPADCDDTNASRHPDLPETACDGIDQDCDGVDEGELDLDSDGFNPCAGDCDDGDPEVFPGAPELCNGVDDDCDGSVDESPVNGTTWYADADNDSYGNPNSSVYACSPPPGYVGNNLDCNDFNAAIRPNAIEVCNSADDDCDGQVDEGVGSIWFRDADLDGFGTSAVTVQSCTPPPGYVSNNLDCNDANASIRPGAPELCNGVDDDCDGQTDENPVNGTTWYRDIDNDGFGAGAPIVACSAPMGYVSNNLDCNDSNAAINPSATELCNGVDDDCDGTVDEGC